MGKSKTIKKGKTKKVTNKIPIVDNNPTLVYAGWTYEFERKKEFQVWYINKNNKRKRKCFNEKKFGQKAKAEAEKFLAEIETKYKDAEIKISNSNIQIIAFLRNGKNPHKKSWTIGKKWDRETAFTQAENWRRYMSNKLGLTTAKSLPPITTTVEEKHKKMIAGFLDGDACIGFGGHSVRIQFAQSQKEGIPEILKFIQNLYGGNIQKYISSNLNKKPAFNLVIANTKDLFNILQDIRPFILIKKQQLELALELLLKKQNRCQIDLEEYKNKFKSLNKVKNYKNIVINSVDVSNEYISGFFCAEGSCYSEKNLCIRLTITQVGCTSILQAIRTFLGYGGLSGFKLKIEAKNRIDFINRILPFSIAKRDQLQVALQTLQSIQKINLNKRKPILQECHEKLKKLKKI